MKKNKKDNDMLSQNMLKGASEYIKQKAFRKNSPIVILEDDKLYLLDKNKKKKEIKTVKAEIKK